MPNHLFLTLQRPTRRVAHLYYYRTCFYFKGLQETGLC